jgi:hypothetical protein
MANPDQDRADGFIRRLINGTEDHTVEQARRITRSPKLQGRSLGQHRARNRNLVDETGSTVGPHHVGKR